MKRRLTARIAVAVAASMVAFLVALIVLIGAVVQLRDAGRDARESERVLRAADSVLALVVNAETSARGFVLTRREGFLEPLRSAQRRLPSAAAALGQMALPTREQRLLADEIGIAAAGYINDYALPLAALARRDEAAARAMIESEAGKTRIDALRLQHGALTSTARLQAERAGVQSEARARRALWIAGGVVLLTLGFKLALLWYLSRSVGRPVRRAAEAAHTLADGDLSVRLPAERHDELGQLGAAFNAMAATLQDNREHLEQQNAELENQNAELERQAVELETQSAELELQAAELETGQVELQQQAADLELKAAEAAWNEHVMRSVLEATGDAIYFVDPEGTRIFENPAMRRFAADVLGISADRSPDDGVDHIQLIAEQTSDPARFVARHRDLLADPMASAVDEYRLEASGRWFFRQTAPVHGRDGELLGRIYLMRETTDHHEGERLKDELLATVSHELRTPLAAVLGFTELLTTRDYDEPERRRYLSTVHEQASRLSELIDDFLDLQRLEQSGQALRRSRFDLHEVLRRQVELFSGQSRVHVLTLKAPEGELLLEADPNQLGRAVANLLSNAIKYSPDGGTVTVDAAAVDGHVTIAVHDEGVGVPPSARAKVFERFYRVDNSATAPIGGTGLGLTLVRQIAEAHGGTVGLDSIEGRGSRFWITIPRG